MMRYNLTQFSAARAEEITGVTGVQQRNWRNRGFLPLNEPKSHARFTLPELSELVAYQIFAGRSIGPTAAQAIIPEVGRGILFFALSWIDAYAGPARHPQPSMTWGETANMHRMKILDENVSLPQPLKFLVWWADDSATFADSLDEAFSTVTASDRKVASGAAVIIDLEAAASRLLACAGVPLVRVDWAVSAPGSDQRPGFLNEHAGMLSAF